MPKLRNSTKQPPQSGCDGHAAEGEAADAGPAHGEAGAPARGARRLGHLPLPCGLQGQPDSELLRPAHSHR